MQEVGLEKQLLTRLRNGDQSAIKDFYKSAFPYCTSYVHKTGGSHEDAREYFQKGMVILLGKLQDPAFDIQYNLKAFLYAVVRNQWIKELKRRGKTGSIDHNDRPEVPDLGEEELEEKQELEFKYEQLYDALKSISEECRNLLQLTYFKKLKDKEIAPLMGYQPNFVRNKRRRCIEGMKKYLGVK